MRFSSQTMYTMFVLLKFFKVGKIHFIGRFFILLDTRKTIDNLI